MKNRGDIELKKIVITSLADLLANEDEEDGAGTSATQKKRKVAKRKGGAPEPKNPLYKQYGQDERSYYHKMDDRTKQYVADLETTIEEMNKEHIPLRFKVLESKIDDKVKAVAIKKLRYLYDLDESSTEYYKITNWIESLCKLPIGRYKPLPITRQSTVPDIREFIRMTKQKLDETVYGHDDAKDQIIRLLAQWISNPESKGMVLGIHGPPGCGKTLIAKNGISKALDLPFAFLTLGGASDASWLDGHSYTYEGSSWGKIVDILMKAQYMNPVLYLDELDKVSSTYKGDEIINLLIHLTDSTQNDKFMDKYFVDVDFDLSRCLIIFSYNDESAINPILKDRMIKIRTDGYKLTDKVKIAQNFLLPELFKQFNLKADDICFKDDHIKYIVTNKIDEEEGVRNLKRGLECIVSNINLNALLNPEEVVLPFHITEKIINTYIKSPKSNNNAKILSMYV